MNSRLPEALPASAVMKRPSPHFSMTQSLGRNWVVDSYTCQSSTAVRCILNADIHLLLECQHATENVGGGGRGGGRAVVQNVNEAKSDACWGVEC